MKRLVFLFCISMWFIPSMIAQQGTKPSTAPSTVQGEIMVMLSPKASIDHFLRKASQNTGFNYDLRYVKCLSPRLNIYLLKTLHTDINLFLPIIESLKGFEEVQLIQPNHMVTLRGTMAVPNDALFSSQWALENTGQLGGVVDGDINATDAWDIHTGGISALGDTMVIAIVDEGVDLTHSDLFFWKNHNEIPGNNVDDDLNGYVDDTDGWNAKNSTGDIVSAQHGTHVSGIAAARGNNSIGISGVNWDAQVMAVVGESPTEAVVVEAYGYVFEMRKRYDETNGREGAFVVATNSSFGVNNADPSNFPIWCAMYDTLGSLGILNAVSTANQQVNVDNVGDMPSTCPSEYVIAVTATNRFDMLHPGSAFGKVNIDLGAPGAQVQSTIPNDSYSLMSGTSMASPHVSGAVAFMLSGSGPEFMSLYKNYPDSAALILKNRLLDGVDPIAGFDTMTTSGGRLNLFNGLTKIMAFNDSLSDCSLPYDLSISEVTDSSAELRWTFVGNQMNYQLRHRPLGGGAWVLVHGTGDSFLLIGLQGCSKYEYQVATICGSDTGDYSAIFTFESEGCCRPPERLSTVVVSETETELAWSSVYAADSFRFKFREAGSMTWAEISLIDTSFTLIGLTPCTEYEVQVITRCDTGLSEAFRELSFTTAGCGFCRETNFCRSESADASEDWIAGVEVGPLSQMSQSDGGYGNYTGNSVDLYPGIAYPLKFTPGFAATAFNEYWRAWIDYNHDGDFEDPGEKIFDSGTTSDTVVTGNFMVPSSAMSGPTRLRVSMRFSLAPNPCADFPFGEVEDYCVELRGLVGVDEIQKLPSVTLFPNPVAEQLNIVSERIIEKIEIFSLQGQMVLSKETGQKEIQLSVSDLPNGLFFIRIKIEGEWISRKIMK